jgi:Protein of unknown function (DUF1565)
MTAFVTLLALLLTLLSADAVAPAGYPVTKPFASVAVDPGEVRCDRFAAPHGSDRLAGTEQRPFRGVPRLLRSLRAGQTGCLAPGRYHHHRPARLRSRGASLVGLGGRAQVDGAIWITAQATGAQIRGLELTASDRTFFIPLKILASRARVAGNRIYGSRSTSCILVGSTRRPRDVRIDRNWIHRCGRSGKLDHLIYVSNAVGTVINGNVLTDNPGGWAVHLYPNADRSIVERNLIDGNQGGVIFAGDGSETADGNVVRANTITFSGPRRNIESSWGHDAIGVGNVAYGNCLYSVGLDSPSGVGTQIGFAAGPSVATSSSPYSLRPRDGYAFARSNGCARLVEPLPRVVERP